MDPSMITAMAGVLGSLVGGSATAATAWITQKTASKRELILEGTRKREALYGEFIAESAKLLIDSFSHTLDKPETLLSAYALLNRIRLSSSGPVLVEAERVLARITDQYFARNLSLEELRELTRTQHADPLEAFGEACRAELKSIRTHA